MKQLRVVHVSSGVAAGEEGRSVVRLHRGLLRLGIASGMLMEPSSTTDAAVMAINRPRKRAVQLRLWLRRARVDRAAAAGEIQHEAVKQFGEEPIAGADLVRQLPPCDILNLHSVAGLVDYRSFFDALPLSLPIVWTLHDMNPFTGGCHYSGCCTRYQDQCGACPQLGSTRTLDLSWEIWRRKRELFASHTGSLHIVTPSRWLAREVARSSVLGDRFPVSVISYGIDTDEFAPRDRNAARNALGLPQDARVVLASMRDADQSRRDFALLAAALTKVAEVTGILLVTLGADGCAAAATVPHHHFARVPNDRLMSLVYSAADLLVVPSMQEHLPAPVLEGMACGVPIVAFDTGGIPEAVRQGVTGALVPAGDAGAFAAAMTTLLANGDRVRELGSNCRRIAVNEYGLEVQARRYVQLYDRLLPERGVASAMSARERALVPMGGA